MSFFEELKRRKVIRVAIGYAAAAWLVLQIADVILGNLSAPGWAFEAVLLLVILGFPVALALAWAFEVRPEVAAGRTASGGRRRLDVIIVLTVIAATGLFAINWFVDDVVSRRGQDLQVDRPDNRPTNAPPSTSIAVLAFENRSADPEQEFLAEGLAEEILILLANVPEFDVISRTSSFSFKGSNEDVRTIGRALGVGSIVEGSIQKSGDRVRITVHLVNAADGRSVWSPSPFEEELTDTFAIQERIAADIVAALQVEIGSLPSRGRPTRNVEAYSNFLKARVALDAQQGGTAVRLLEEAVGFDPNFAEAWEYLAFAYWQQSGTSIDVTEAQAESHDAAAKALQIEPALIFAQALHALSDEALGDDGRAVELLIAATREQPANSAPMRTLLYELGFRGYLAEAHRMATQFVERDPLSPVAHYSLGESLVAVGRSGEALAPLKRAYELENAFASWFLPAVHLLRGDDEAAAAIYEQQLEAAGLQTSVPILELIRRARESEGGADYFDTGLSGLLATVPEAITSDWLWNNWIWHLIFGHLDDYYELIDAAEPQRGQWTDADVLIWLGTIFRETGFTAHPRFVEMSERVGSLMLWDIRGAPDFCQKTAGEWHCE